VNVLPLNPARILQIPEPGSASLEEVFDFLLDLQHDALLFGDVFVTGSPEAVVWLTGSDGRYEPPPCKLWVVE
jgi:hypothetical protein